MLFSFKNKLNPPNYCGTQCKCEINNVLP